MAKKETSKAAPAKAGATAKKTTASASAKSETKGATASKGKTAAKGEDTKAKRTPNAAFMKPMNIGAALHSIVGSDPLPRTEVTKKVWEYIKKNKLQDAKEKRNINADTNLQKVFGGKKTVNMFEMTKMINQHLS